MNKLCIGIIGLGGAGRAHAVRFQKNKMVREVIAYDPKESQMRGVRACSNLDELLSEADAVSICTPDSTHFDYIVKCMNRGKHVLVEKPMVSSYTEAQALGATIRENPNLKFAVHHQMRFVPAFREAKKLIDRKELGSIFYMEANYWHDMRTRNTLYDDWRLKENGQSVIYGGACHPLDLLLHLADNEVVSHNTILNKNGYPDFPDDYTSATTLLRFSDNVVAKCHTNNCVVFPQVNNLIILGDKGTYIDGVLYKNDKFNISRILYENNSSVNSLKKFIPEFPLRLFLNFLSRRQSFRANPFSVYNHNHACQVIVDNFITAVLKDELVLVGYEDGCRVIRLCQETEASGLASLNGQNMAKD